MGGAEQPLAGGIANKGAVVRMVALIGQCHEIVHRRLTAGEPAFVEAWERCNGTGRERLSPPWLAGNDDAIVAAVAGA